MLRSKTAFLAWILPLALAPAALAGSLPTPAGPILPVGGHPAELYLSENVLVAPRGDYVEVTWEPAASFPGGDQLFGQRFGSDGTPRGDRFLVDTTNAPPVLPSVGVQSRPGVFLDDDHFIIVWIVSRTDTEEDVYFRLFEGAGTALTEPIRQIRDAFTTSLHVAGLGDERLVMTTTTDTGDLQVDLAEFQVLRTDGSVVAMGRVGREIPDPFPCAGQFTELVLGLGITAPGGFQVVFSRAVSQTAPPVCQELPRGVFLRTFNADGQALGPEIELADDDSIGASDAELIEGLGWLLTGFRGPDSSEGRWFSVEGEPLSAAFQIGARFMEDPFGQEIAQLPDGTIVIGWKDFNSTTSELERRLRALEASCTPGPTTLCLGGGRFRIDVDWLDFRDRQGSGKATPLSDETGYFTFFNGDNVELVVKVLDGQPRNGNFWVFYGALSNVRYRLLVTDTERGLQQVYDNPAQTFASTGDTAAFPGDGGGVPIQGALKPAEIAALLPGIPADGPGLATAGESTEELSFHGGRFRASTTWRDFLDRSGSGQGTMLTEDTGYFWFFRPENVEVVVKVLDGRPKNGHWWVFYGALTNVEYTLSVEDTESGTANEYFNPLRTFASDGDTLAFPE